MSKERGSLTPISKEAYSLREMISAATRAEYEIQEALPDFPPPVDHASWYLLGRELRGPKGTAHAHTVWEDEQGNVFIQSIYLGNITEWVGPTYGEKGAIAAFKLDYSDFPAARKILAEKFPRVEQRLSSYEKILADVSTRHHVALSLACEGERGTATFYAVAKIEAGDLAADKKAEMLRLNVRALKDAWAKIQEYGRKEESTA